VETGDTAELSCEEHPRPFYLPDHLSFASEGIVTSILSRCGFRIVSIKKYSISPFRPIAALKDAVRRFWLGKKSRQRTPFNSCQRNPYITDMYVRASSNSDRSES
jgi:hypothetical protein